MHYKQPRIIDQETGNNSFSFSHRAEHLGKAELQLPTLQKIEEPEEIELGTHPVFEEVNAKGELKSCTGLQHIYQIDLPQINPFAKTPRSLYVFDNHNHALYFWSQYANALPAGESLKLLHIDQHSDLKEPLEPIDLEQITDDEYMRTYTNYTCNVGNFIMPFVTAYPFTSFEWIKAENQLLSYAANLSSYDHLILDIDLDFRAPEMSNEKYEESIEKTKELMSEASLITIATSPYYLDQTRALEILADLLT